VAYPPPANPSAPRRFNNRDMFASQAPRGTARLAVSQRMASLGNHIPHVVTVRPKLKMIRSNTSPNVALV